MAEAGHPITHAGNGPPHTDAVDTAGRSRLLDERERILAERERLLNDRERALDEREGLLSALQSYATLRDRTDPRLVITDASLAGFADDQLAIARALKDLARRLYGLIAVPDVLATLVRYLTEVVDCCDSGCAVCWARGSEAMVASDEHATAIAQMANEVGEGPLLDMSPGADVICASGDELRRRWPTFGARLSDLGFDAVQTQPLSLQRNGQRLDFGVVTLFGRHPFDESGVELAALAASHGAVALARARIEAIAAQDAARLQRAIASRDLLGRAKGILIERHKCTDAEAFDRLRATSQRLNMKVAEVAEHLVLQGELPN